jgi:hypothetical protein
VIAGIVAWWLAGAAAGAAAFPIAWRVFDRLPDRGYGLSRTLGILLGGYLLWLSASVGILRNSPGGAVAALLMVAAGGMLAGRGHWNEIRQWLRANAGTVLAMEGLFLAAFVGWAVVRAFNPEIVATEKPMELAFLNAILRSPQLPPQDRGWPETPFPTATSATCCWLGSLAAGARWPSIWEMRCGSLWWRSAPTRSSSTCWGCATELDADWRRCSDR